MSKVSSEPHPVKDGSPTRLTSDPIVANCLDTLKINFSIEWSTSQFLNLLERAKSKAQENDFDSEPVEFTNGVDWNVFRSGTRRYSYRIKRGDVTLLFSRRPPKENNFNSRLEIGSISCWAPGYFHVYEEIIRMIEMFGGIIQKESVSEVHLAADFIGADITTLPIYKEDDQWISRGHDQGAFRSRRKFTGTVLGMDSLMLRVYDKVAKLKKETHKQVVFAAVWGLESFDQSPVTRVEFQLRRKILAEFFPEIQSMTDLMNNLAGVWKYCTTDWCRLSSEPVDRNHHQSRAELHPFWKMVQSVSWQGQNHLERKNLRFKQKDLSRLMKLFSGVGMSISALYGCGVDDLEGVIATSQGAIETELRKMYKRDKKDFIRRMQRKTNESVGPFSVIAGEVVL